MAKTCGIRRQGWKTLSRGYQLTCVLWSDHVGQDHRDGLGRTWQQTEAPEAAEAKSAERLAFEAECEAFEALKLKREEWRYIDAKLTELHQRQHNGDDSELTRIRIGRLEALEACLCGDPRALAQEPPRRSLRA